MTKKTKRKWKNIRLNYKGVIYEKITKVSERPIDGRVPSMSISSEMYQRGLAKLRKQAKEEHKKLLTENGTEDYTNYKE